MVALAGRRAGIHDPLAVAAGVLRRKADALGRARLVARMGAVALP